MSSSTASDLGLFPQTSTCFALSVILTITWLALFYFLDNRVAGILCRLFFRSALQWIISKPVPARCSPLKKQIEQIEIHNGIRPNSSMNPSRCTSPG